MTTTTDSYFRDGRLIGFKPESFVWSVTRNTLIGTLDRPEDRAVLGALFSGPSPVPLEEVRERFDRGDLSPDGQQVYDIFVNRDPDRVAGLITALPKGVKSGLQRLSPVNAAEAMHAHVLILHENGDPYFASWESENLMGSLQRGNADLTLTSIVQHAELRLPPPTPENIFGFYLREGWKLALTFSRFFQQRRRDRRRAALAGGDEMAPRRATSESFGPRFGFGWFARLALGRRRPSFLLTL